MKTVNIIGAGIAGLSAGCYLQMNGYETRIFELHNLPGGLCTGWKRGEYTFDGCVHWLVGTNPQKQFYSMWNELIDMSKVEVVDHEAYATLKTKDGQSLTLYTDVDRLEKELLEKAPEDEKFIRSMVKSIKKLSKLKMNPEKAPEVMGAWEGLQMLVNFMPYMTHFRKWNKRTRVIAEQVKNPLLKKAIFNSFDPDMSFVFMLFTLAWMNNKDAGYPVGGSLLLANEIEKRYKQLGGKLYYHNKIEKILTEKSGKKDKAVGVVTKDGQVHSSDITISAADGHDTLFRMLDEKYRSEKYEKIYKEFLPFPSYFQVSLGIGKKLNVESTQLIELDEPIIFDPETKFSEISFRTFDCDPTMAPEGKTALTLMLTGRNHEYWMKLRTEDREQYKAEKSRIAREVIDALDKHLGDIKDHVEEVDVSTPATVVRYTNNWKGSFEGWIMTPEVGFRQLKKTLPKLDDFYMIGQWVEPGGGLPTALRSGRNVAQLICKNDKRKFRTEHF